MSEHNEQATFIETVLWKFKNRPDFFRLLLFAVPNGAWLGGNGAALMNKMKSEGLVNGVSDILYLQPRGGFAFLSLEMKTKERKKEKDGGVSPDQLEWMKAAHKVNAYSVVCYGADEAVDVFEKYMLMEA